MPDLLPPNTDEMVAALEREIMMRQSVYPRRVADKKMSQARADREIEVMKAILDFVRLRG